MSEKTIITGQDLVKTLNEHFGEVAVKNAEKNGRSYRFGPYTLFSHIKVNQVNRISGYIRTPTLEKLGISQSTLNPLAKKKQGYSMSKMSHEQINDFIKIVINHLKPNGSK